MQDGRPFARSLPALRWLILVACTLSVTVEARIMLPGIYQGHAAKSDPAKRTFTLSLQEDGTAAFTTQYLGKEEVVEHGHWTRNGTQVVLTLDPMGPNRPPAPITFHYRQHVLIPLHWDASEWGRSGPPAFHRTGSTKGGT
jgi:hypothetical protein